MQKLNLFRSLLGYCMISNKLHSMAAAVREADIESISSDQSDEDILFSSMLASCVMWSACVPGLCSNDLADLWLMRVPLQLIRILATIGHTFQARCCAFSVLVTFCSTHCTCAEGLPFISMCEFFAGVKSQ